MPSDWESLISMLFNVRLLASNLFQVSYKYGMSDKARELTVCLLKKFIALNPEVALSSPDMLEYGLVALSISTKVSLFTLITLNS